MKDRPRASDEALVAAAKAGDRGASGLLVEKYQDLVCAIAYGCTANHEAAQDIAQDAFLASFEKLPTLRFPSRYRAWLERIARRLCSNWIRSESYRRALVRGLRAAGNSQTTASPEDILTEREDKAVLQRAIPRRRAEEWSHHTNGGVETGETLGRSYARKHVQPPSLLVGGWRGRARRRLSRAFRISRVLD